MLATIGRYPLKSLLLVPAATAASVFWAHTAITPRHIVVFGFASIIAVLIDAPLLAASFPMRQKSAADAALNSRKTPGRVDAWIAISSWVLANLLLGIDVRFVYAGGPPPPGRDFPPLHSAIVLVVLILIPAFCVCSFRCWLTLRKRRRLSVR